MRYLLCVIIFISLGRNGFAQYDFSGRIDTKVWQSDVYLSVIEDYRTLAFIDNEQIISKAPVDSLGHFSFVGNQLEPEHRIYKLHVDDCDADNEASNHFDRHCSQSKDIIFIAKNTDSINFPLSFDAEMFCDIVANNPKTAALVKIDSLKEEMKFAYSEFRSKANRNLNNKKWFKTLQSFGKSLDEPLAELYIYAFLSERGSPFHDYYLQDLRTNTFYDGLLERLQSKYPNTTYTAQYKAEITSDRYIASPQPPTKSFNWKYLLIIALALSLLTNFWLVYRHNSQKKKLKAGVKEQLTKQEQNVLDLILKGHTNKEIATSLFISLSTVKTHVNNLYKKLSVNSRNEIKSLYNK
ncbi:hypothetical protein MHTCC0001_29590 [Flavobacteriaceae bacterium MHTCC 0001]